MDKATDQELIALFDVDNADELEDLACGKRGMLFIQTCAGQWMKYEGSTEWVFQIDAEWEE